METYGAPHVMQEELKDFEHDWESHLLLREADAKGAAATPMAAPAGCLDAVPDVPAMREEDEQLLLPDTTWPFTGPRWSDTDNAVSDMANKLFNDYTYGVFQPFCSGAIEYDSDFDPSPLCSLLPGARALHTGDSRPLEVDAGDLPPPEVGATGAGPKRRNSLGSAFAGFSRVLHRGPSLSPTVHRPALRGASRWFLPRSACPNNSAWVRMVTGPASSASADVHWG